MISDKALNYRSSCPEKPLKILNCLLQRHLLLPSSCMCISKYVAMSAYIYLYLIIGINACLFTLLENKKDATHLMLS